MARRLPRHVSLRDLHNFILDPTPEKVVQSGRFLSSELPVRVGHTRSIIERLPRSFNDSYGIRRFLIALADAQKSLAEIRSPTSLDEAIAHSQEMNMLVKSLDIDARNMCNSVRDDEKRVKSYPEAAHTLGQATFECLISSRALTSHYAHAASTHLPATAGPMGDEVKKQTVVRMHAIPQLVQIAILDSRAFSVEKFGVAPQVTLRLGTYPGEVVSLNPAETQTLESIEMDGMDAVCVDSMVHYICMEILKNSFRSMIQRFGELEIGSEEYHVDVHVSSSDSEVGITIEDFGGGMSETSRRSARRFFHSTAPPITPNYTYSRQFGAAFDGLGFGVPMSRLYAELMGGSLSLVVRPGQGTAAFIVIAKNT
ncbi:hypothetical protein AAMO2058_000301600 [Amorphochlora amoebiformis]